MSNQGQSVSQTENHLTTQEEESKKPVSLSQMQSVIFAVVFDVALWTYLSLVSYKIFFQRYIMGMRFPEFSWSQPLACLAVGTIIAFVLFFTRASVGRAIKGLYEIDENKGIGKEPFTILGYTTLIITFIAGIHISQVSMYEFLSESGLRGAQRIFTALFTPNFAIFEDAMFAAIETIYMAFVATVVALPIAFTMSFFAARNLMNQSKVMMSVYAITRFFLNLTRSIEPLVWAIIFSVWVGIGPFAGMLALCIHSISSLAKLYSEQIENISDGPIEAITATGAHPIQVVWYGVVPQIILPYLAFTIYRWDINVRMATVIGLVGGGGIGTLLMQYQGLARWNEVGLLVIVIASIVWVMDYASSKIRAAIK